MENGKVRTLILIIQSGNQTRFSQRMRRSVNAFSSHPPVLDAQHHIPCHQYLPSQALPPPPFFPSTAPPAAESASPTLPAPAADVMAPASSSAPPVAPAAASPLPSLLPLSPRLRLRPRWGFFFPSLSPTAAPAPESASPTLSAPASDVMPPARSRAPPTMLGTASGGGFSREVESFLGTTVSVFGCDLNVVRAC